MNTVYETAKVGEESTMTKQEAVQEFIDFVDRGQFGVCIVRNPDTRTYHTYGTAVRMLDREVLVYTYPMFVNSDANLEVDDLATRF